MKASRPDPLRVLIRLHFDESCVVARVSVTLNIGGRFGGLEGGLESGSQGCSQGGHQPAPGTDSTRSFLAQLQRPAEDNYLRVVEVDGSGPGDERYAVGAFKPGVALIAESNGSTLSWTYDVIPSNTTDGVEGLHKTKEGIVGLGKNFLPKVGTDTLYDITVEWDLSGAPAGTCGVSSFGEETSKTSGTMEMLLNTFFMVGKINSFPPVDKTQPSPSCGTYWLGDLPPNLAVLAGFSNAMYPRLSTFFRDEDGGYRLFFCETRRRGFRGTVCHNSSLIEYGDDVKDEHDWELVKLLNWNMISRWARLDAEDDGTDNDWFANGIASLYTIYLPYRFGQRPPDYFRDTLNGYLSSYFTNPLVNTPSQKLESLHATSWHAKSALNRRSCMYMILTDAFSRRASVQREAGVERPIDEIVADICVRRRRGEKIQRNDWMRAVAEWVGQDEADQLFRKMVSGDLLDFEPISSGFGGSLVIEEQRIMEFGFDRGSLESNIVKGVVTGSAAADAGLKDGDRILCTTRPEFCETHYEAKFEVTVNRCDGEARIEYWPRAQQTVRLWQSRQKPA